VLGADQDDIEIIYQGQAQVQQALATGAVDAAAILEPIVTNILKTVDGATVVARGSQMFEGQPGAVLAVRENLISTHPDVVKALVDAHARATDILNDNPDAAVDPVRKYVGGGRMSKAIVTAAIDASRGSFVADPGQIINGSIRMRDLQKELGTLKKDVDVNALILTTFYDALNR
jgi:NitT/TauT family transport system substrate-binding protein